jgi:hypothetical protein
MAVDTQKPEQFLGQFVTDLGATVHAGMVVIEGWSVGMLHPPTRSGQKLRTTCFGNDPP